MNIDKNHFSWELLNYSLDNYKIWEENYDLIIIFFLKNIVNEEQNTKIYYKVSRNKENINKKSKI